jgi:hypothetical protein
MAGRNLFFEGTMAGRNLFFTEGASVLFVPVDNKRRAGAASRLS